MSDNQDILRERGQQWGDHRATHEAIAKLWPVMAYENMLFENSFINPKEEDSYKDSKGYIDIASFIAEPSEEITARYLELASYLGKEGEEE